MRSPHSTGNRPANDREAILNARIQHMHAQALRSYADGFKAMGQAMVQFVKGLK